MHLNPDHFLATPSGRVWTPERNARARARCFEALPGALQAARDAGARLYVLVGPQGWGKSTWAALQRQREPHCVVFDAILVKRSEREPVLLQAHAFAVPAVAVWFRTPLQVCIARNAARAADEIADERGLRNVFAAVEPPLAEEGFAQVLQMDMPGS
jgi:predicted kinase